ncbi:MAG: ATP-binding protein [Patescibacteria group bacterium]|nr:ATP-binding protein [Patescibacteria group bacterium]
MIIREIKKQLKKAKKEYPVILLTGPRQSGKTTLVRDFFSNYSYVNLEDLEIRDFAISDPKGFLNQFKKGVIIDEVQRVPDLLSQIQVIVDESKKNGQFILTGSQNFLLFEKASQSLAGRVAIFNLLPLSLSELSLENKLKKTDVWDLVFKGFYPKLYDHKMDISLYYSNYVKTYIERDVRLIKNISSLHSFKNFLNFCAGRCGQILNYSSLASDAGIDQRTAKEWLSILEASFVIFLLKPYYKNFSKRVVKMPKIYFYDTGLLCFLLGISNKEDLNRHYLKGGIFESFVISNFFKNRYNQGLEPNIYYWRDKTGNEVDVIIESGKGAVPIEIKSGQTIGSDYFNGLRYYNKISKEDNNKFFVVYSGEKKQERSYGTIIPWSNLVELDF